MSFLFVLICILLIILAIEAVWLIFADGDLTLMFMERFGRKADVLKGKVVWITGASSGIGQHLAYQFARIGCRLILSARSKEGLEAVQKNCLTYSRTKEDDILVLPLDMTDLQSHNAATETALAKFGQIDILINNAGRSQRAWIADTELAVDREMLELNVVGQISLTKTVLPHMISRRSGQVIVTSSIAGKVAAPFSATYCMTKAAVNMWFGCLAIEMAPYDIGVSVICPGPVLSNITQVAFTAKSGKMHGEGPEKDLKRMPTSRCAELMIIAIANKLSEVWISPHPVLFLTYFAEYMPSMARWGLRVLGVKRIMKMREGR